MKSLNLLKLWFGKYKSAGINPALLYEGAPGVSASGGVVRWFC